MNTEKSLVKTIDLSKVIKDNNLDQAHIAVELFPNVKYPKLALNRVMKGEAVLDEHQILTLSSITGLSIEQLFNNVTWKMLSSNGFFKFTNGDFEAVLDIKRGTTRIYKKNEKIHETVMHDSTIPLNTYLEQLTQIITNLI